MRKILKEIKRRFILSGRYLKGQLMITTFHFFPEYAYKFVPEGRLPNPAQRTKKGESILDDFGFEDVSVVPLKKMGEINIVMRGNSLRREDFFNLKGPTFLVNYHEKVDIPDVYYFSADRCHLKWYISDGHTPLFNCSFGLLNQNDPVGGKVSFRDIEKVLGRPENKSFVMKSRFDIKSPHLGSGLVCILLLLKYADKINIYGWDQYLTLDVEKSVYGKLLRRMYVPMEFGTPTGTISCAMYNYYFAILFAKDPRIINHGRTRHLHKCKQLEKKLEKVFIENK